MIDGTGRVLLQWNDLSFLRQYGKPLYTDFQVVSSFLGKEKFLCQSIIRSVHVTILISRLEYCQHLTFHFTMDSVGNVDGSSSSGLCGSPQSPAPEKTTAGCLGRLWRSEEIEDQRLPFAKEMAASIALTRLVSSLLPLPARVKPVPWSTLVRMIGRPSVTFTPSRAFQAPLSRS